MKRKKGSSPVMDPPMDPPTMIMGILVTLQNLPPAEITRASFKLKGYY